MKQKGFTLIEVAMAIAVLGAAVAFSAYTTRQVSSGYSQDRQMSKAHEIAGTLMEELLATYSSDPRLAANDHTQLFADARFTAKWTVRINYPLTKIMEIRLHVTWSEDGHQRGVHYVTYRRT